MASFSIDEVRDSFSADMTQFLAEMDAAAGVLGSSLKALPAFPMDDHQRPLFEAIAAQAHAAAGTGSLVGARSLSESARRLEALTLDGQIALNRARSQIDRAVQVVQLCAQGAEAMREMLALELDHRRGEAEEAAERWQRQADLAPVEELRTQDLDVLGEVRPRSPESPNAELAPVAEEFTFEDDAPAPAPSAAGGREFSFEAESAASAEVMDELKGMFRQELRDTLPELQSHLDAIKARSEDLVAAGQLERIYHTLKGAAATVGLNQIHQLAASLQRRLEQSIESGAGAPRALVDDLVQDTDRLLELAGLSALGTSAPTAPESASGDAGSAAELFLQEARSIIEESSRLVADLAAAAAGDAGPIRARLAGLLHRLKGSSLVAGDVAAADVAAELQQRCESGSPIEASTIADELRRLGAMIASSAGRRPTAQAASSSRRERIEVEQDRELWEAFRQECTELLEGIEKEVLALEDTDQPRRLLESLMRRHHTLKGASNSVGLAPTGRLLHRVEDFLEGLLEAPFLPPMKEVANLLLEVQVEVRKHLATAPQGYVENALSHMDTRIREVISGARVTTARAPADTSKSRSSAETGSGGSSAQVVTAPEKRFVRVATEQLDSLMNLAGALVVSRSRLASRVSTMRSVQRDLGRSQHRLFEHVEEFVSAHEFDNLDARAAAARPTHPVEEGEATGFSQFGALELDRYDDVHVLSRSLAEVSNDLSEVFGQLLREMSGIADDADAFGGIVSGIQREVTRARMVPLESMFTRLRLPVRDAAAREQKEVRVTVSGEDVHLDKAIADAMFQPMLHLVRNAVVHGIESSVGRAAAGKPRLGTIHLGARQESGQIVLEVRDDGCGLDLAGLYSRGVAMGLLPQGTPLNDPTVKDLIFAPGLSTDAEAGMVSGRGFGCDVVRRSIERLNGTIRVENGANREAGTCFVITLPLTLAITRALLVRLGGRLYAIPLHFAEHIFELGEARVIEALGARRMRLGDSFIAVRSLGDVFGTGERPRPDGPVLVLRVGQQHVALQVDAVVAQEEVVVKSLGELLQAHPVLAGVTIRGNGELVLIIDVPGVIEQVTQAPETPRGSRGPLPAVPPPPAEPPAGEAPGAVDDRQDASAAIAGDATLPPGGAAAGPGEGKALVRVLFVDDSISVRKVAERVLLGLGVEVAVAVDGLDALEKLRARTFDLVFTDLEMPRMHGYELIRELRFVPAYRDLPVVVVSSRSGQKHRDEARTLGANDYLTKPFNAEMLDAALKRWVRRRTVAPGGRGTS
jgi:chemosensory pili system protein ChpA (sensor histidine kinase/response regulator)